MDAAAGGAAPTACDDIPSHRSRSDTAVVGIVDCRDTTFVLECSNQPFGVDGVVFQGSWPRTVSIIIPGTPLLRSTVMLLKRQCGSMMISKMMIIIMF